MRIALTGTPGVGKTSIAEAARRRGIHVVDVKAWAESEDCVVAFDDEDDALVIDTVELAHLVPDDDGKMTLYDGHLSHLLGLDLVWVVRADPGLVRARLQARGYAASKVAENVEAEALDIILQESLDATKRVIQRDGSKRTPDEMLSEFLDATRRLGKTPDVESVDWSEHLVPPGGA